MSSQVVDPVCGMKVDPANSAGSIEYKGTTYHFCGVRCLEKFKNDPENFVTRTSAKAAAAKGGAPLQAAAEAPLYTCPMHPEIRQDHPGSCRKCGMALEPVAPIQPVSKTCRTGFAIQSEATLAQKYATFSFRTPSQTLPRRAKVGTMWALRRHSLSVEQGRLERPCRAVA
jgi:YHS domain-containing protein